MTTRLDAIIDLTLEDTLSGANQSLEDFCNLWNIRVLRSGTHRHAAAIAVPWPSFKKMFHCNPTPKILAVPKALTGFITHMRVRGITIIEMSGPCPKE